MSKLPYFNYSSFYVLCQSKRWWFQRETKCHAKDSYHRQIFPLYANQRLGYPRTHVVQYIKRNVTAVPWFITSVSKRKKDLQEPWLTHSFWLLLVFLDQWMCNEWRWWCNTMALDDSHLIEWEFLNNLNLFGVE